MIELFKWMIVCGVVMMVVGVWWEMKGGSK